MNVKDEINRAIGVARARQDYLIRYEGFRGCDFPEDEYNAICTAIYSLERWRDDSETQNLPEIARQMIDLKQWELTGQDSRAAEFNERYKKQQETSHR
jgi:hypothetical protein